MRRYLLAPALTLALAAALTVPAHANCGAEGCPFAPLGPEAPRGMFSFDVGYQSIDQDGQWLGNHSISRDEALEEEGGIGHVLELETRTRSVLLVGRARISDALNLTATMPHIDRFHRHTLAHLPGHFIPAEWHFKGWGDASLVASWRAWGGANPSASAITVFAGIKVPTGEKHVEEIGGEEPEPPVRPGSGSTDGQFGLQWSRVATMHTLQGETAGMPLTVSLMTRVNGVGTDDYRMGNELQFAITGGYPLTRWAHAIAQINAASHGTDDVGETDAEPHHTGSTSVYASPGLRISVMPGLNAYAYWQARVFQHTNGPQLSAPYHLSIGTSYSLGR